VILAFSPLDLNAERVAVDEKDVAAVYLFVYIYP